MKYRSWGIILLAFSFLTACKANNRDGNDLLEGKWLLHWDSQDIGLVKTFIEFKTDNGHFEAFSRKKASKDILGTWNSLLARVFTGKLKDGSIIRIEKGVFEIQNDTVRFKGVFSSLIGSYYIHGDVINGQLTATLSNRAGKIKGTLSGTKEKANPPLEDYPALLEKAIKLTEENIYNQNILHSKAWKIFGKNMRTVSTKVQDDLEMVAAFFFHARKLPLSHYYLMKIPQPLADSTGQLQEKHVFWEERSSQTVYMNINSFAGSAMEMDSAFSIINQKGYENLIIDLRNNPGGNIEASLAFAQNLVDRPFYGGIFLTRKWFDNHSEIPAVTDYEKFPHFSEANFELLSEGIHTMEGLCLKILPNKTVYHGNVYILTSKKTASACEPVVYGLKQQNRAIIIGETTAGAMLSSEAFELDKGFTMYIPTADYYTSDGFRIDQNGVKPNSKVKAEKALEYVEKNLIKSLSAVKK